MTALRDTSVDDSENRSIYLFWFVLFISVFYVWSKFSGAFLLWYRFIRVYGVAILIINSTET